MKACLSCKLWGTRNGESHGRLPFCQRAHSKLSSLLLALAAVLAITQSISARAFSHPRIWRPYFLPVGQLEGSETFHRLYEGGSAVEIPSQLSRRPSDVT